MEISEVVCSSVTHLPEIDGFMLQCLVNLERLLIIFAIHNFSLHVSIIFSRNYAKKAKMVKKHYF